MMNKKIGLDSILLLLLGFIFLHNSNTFYVNAFIYVIFFVTVFVYMLMGENKWKKYLLFFIILSCVVETLVPDIVMRRLYPNLILAHDNVLQVEEAANFLIQGKNPYTENYFNTSMQPWMYIRTTLGANVFNGALVHCIKLPWHILSAVPAKLFFEWCFGFYDQRMVYLLLYVLSLVLVYQLPKGAENKRLLTVLFGLNPLFVDFVVQGRDDVFVIAFLLLFIYYLKEKKYLLSSAMLGLALASKHSVWFVAPFYMLYVYLKEGQVKISIKRLYPAAIVFLLLVMPFVVWDFKSFWQDIYQYPSGALATSYHINGYGFSMWLYNLGVIESIFSFYPAWVFQLPFGLLLFYLLYKWQKKNNTIAQMVLGYALFVFVFWFFSRFFHDNYIGYLSQIFLIGYFLEE